MPLSCQFYTGFGMHIAAFLIFLLSFIMPLWIQSFESNQSMFTKAGLWEVCFNNYINEEDVDGKRWNGCYSTYRNGPIRDLWERICPAWFLSLQVLSTLVLLCMIVACTLLVLYYIRCCQSRSEGCAIFSSAALMILSGVIEFIVVIIFGVKGDDRKWLPRPDINYYSWSYAFAVFASFFAFISGFFLIMDGMQNRRTNKSSRSERAFSMGARAKH